MRTNGLSPERRCYIGLYFRYSLWYDSCVVRLLLGSRDVLSEMLCVWTLYLPTVGIELGA
jgi:hypothetical protein